jgi:hypothetical protein
MRETWVQQLLFVGVLASVLAGLLALSASCQRVVPQVSP